MIEQSPRKAHTLSSQAKRGIRFCAIFFGLLSSVPGSAQTPPKRPRILGIAEVKLFSRDLGAARNFYTQILGFKETSHNAFFVNPQQVVTLFDAPSPIPSNLLAEVVFETDNLGGLQKYLKARKIRVTSNLVTEQHWDVIRLGYSALSVIDPEGHRISFIQYKSPLKSDRDEAQTSSHIIHAGFVVHDRAATDHFYKDILGFRPYWHGGMKDNKDDWVALQVPDGTDWVEYMLNISPTADERTLGVMNHIALGVKDIHATQQQLIKNGWKPGEEPKLGRDGKWQLNLYDPDDTRVEFMEFKPVEKSCCSEFTGPHPGPKP
jgi:catechol 2,3-dioxygenase-like lactoylglutathione lyase family enzyme